MLDILKVRINHGKQYITNIRKAELKYHRGLPIIEDKKCENCSECVKKCPTGAIMLEPFRIDLGRCIFCGDCERFCPKSKIIFTSDYNMAYSECENLIVSNNEKKQVKARKDIKKIFGRSLKLRQVSAGGCNGCELELNACSNPNFDMGRFGIEFTASPRHADGIVITGPVTENMAEALEDTLNAVPQPRLIIAVGACAISGGIFASSKAINRSFFEKHKIDLYIPGCPPHPLTIINGILSFIR